MAREPADYKEWHSRRNTLAMTICSAKCRSEGGVCGCYNGDSAPDEVHFPSCKRYVTIADVALQSAEVPIPPIPEPQTTRIRRRY